MNTQKWFIFPILSFSLACSHQKTAARNVDIIDNNGVIEKTDASTVNGKPTGNKSVMNYSRQTEEEGVKVINKTATEFEFEASGHASNEDLKEAIKRAEDDARYKAVTAAGSIISNSAYDVLAQHGEAQYQFIARYLTEWTSNLVESHRIAKQCNLKDEIVECLVTIRGTVHSRGDVDPDFELTTELDKPAYFAGDNIGLSVKASKDSYLSIISFDEDENAYLVFPNKFAQEGFIKGGIEFRIPEDSTSKMTAWLPQGHSESKELLHVILTKKQPLFMLNMLKEDDSKSGFVRYSLGGLKVVFERLAKLPRSDWAEQMLPYEIQAK